jgi:hypothetical protein
LPDRLSEKGRRWQEFPVYPVSLITGITRSSDHPVIWSSDHPIIRSSGLPITRSSGHPIISPDHLIIRSPDYPITRFSPCLGVSVVKLRFCLAAMY